MTTAPTIPAPEVSPKKPKWLRIDDSACKQRGRQLGPGVYEFKEKRPRVGKVRATIVLVEYDEARQERDAGTYYGSLAGLKADCAEDWQFILAECIFELLPLSPKGE